MIEAIHQSSLNMALRCGEQFRKRYIEDEIIPPGVAAGRGTGVHKANKVNLKQKVASQEDLPLSDLKDAARDGFVYAFRNGVYLPEEDIPQKDELLNQGLNETLRLTELYKNEVAPEIQPIDVERNFKIEVPGIPLPLAGRIDIEQVAKVDDLKTTTKSWAEGQIEKEIQPIFYSYAHEKETGVRPEFWYHILIALKKSEKRQVQKITPTDNHYEALFAKLKMICQMLKSGTFLPANPSSWWCSRRFCGYWSTCVYVGNSPKQNWV